VVSEYDVAYKRVQTMIRKRYKELQCEIDRYHSRTDISREDCRTVCYGFRESRDELKHLYNKINDLLPHNLQSEIGDDV